MVGFGKYDQMIKKKMEKWLNQTLSTSLMVIFHSLFKEELLQPKRN